MTIDQSSGPPTGAITAELRALASIFAIWGGEAPDIPTVYIFGSRVRGDHRPDSDVDVRLYLNEWRGDEETSWWWMYLKAQLPGPLALHREPSDNADGAIRDGMKTPVLVIGKAICVWTPPRRPG
jgi:predicted nucleotidyltransferase